MEKNKNTDNQLSDSPELSGFDGIHEVRDLDEAKIIRQILIANGVSAVVLDDDKVRFFVVYKLWKVMIELLKISAVSEVKNKSVKSA